MGNRAQVIIEDTKQGVYTHWYSFELWDDVTTVLKEHPELWDKPKELRDAFHKGMMHGKYDPMDEEDALDHGDLDFQPILVSCENQTIGVHVPAWTGYLLVSFDALEGEETCLLHT
jgi:hypothetical protein